MADDKRLDLDANDDIGLVNKDLLKDVMAATEHAKQRKADDKAQDQKQKTQAKDQNAMIIIIAVAAVAIFAIAYWMIFMRESPQQAIQGPPPSRRQTAPVQQPTPPRNQQNMGYGSNMPNQTAPVVSDPVRSNPSDTYADPQDTGGGF